MMFIKSALCSMLFCTFYVPCKASWEKTASKHRRGESLENPKYPSAQSKKGWKVIGRRLPVPKPPASTESPISESETERHVGQKNWSSANNIFSSLDDESRKWVRTEEDASPGSTSSPSTKGRSRSPSDSLNARPESETPDTPNGSQLTPNTSDTDDDRKEQPSDAPERREPMKPRVIWLSPQEYKDLETADETLTKLNISSDNNILVVGESGFQFSRILAAGLFCKRIEEEKSEAGWNQKKPKKNGVKCVYKKPADTLFVATSLTTDKDLIKSDKDKDTAKSNIKAIQAMRLDLAVHRGVDAHHLKKTLPKLAKDAPKFDKIIWTLPYSGGGDHGENRRLIKDFFLSVKVDEILKDNGEIHLLLNGKGQGQYENWKLKDARLFSLARDSVPIAFKGGICEDLPGYTATRASNKQWEPENARMYIFKRNSIKTSFHRRMMGELEMPACCA